MPSAEACRTCMELLCVRCDLPTPDEIDAVQQDGCVTEDMIRRAVAISGRRREVTSDE
jgi:hypothetical protein